MDWRNNALIKEKLQIITTVTTYDITIIVIIGGKMEELFIMSNSNTLISLAYIRSTDNPFIVVCNLIQYVLSFSESKGLRFDEIKNQIVDRTGITLPNHVINSCTNYLSRKGVLEKLPLGSGYKINKIDFNISLFEQDKIRLESAERFFMEDLVDYVKNQYKIEWTKEEANKYLSSLLLSDSVTESILNHDLQSENNLKRIQPEWYVKKYILEVMKDATSIKYKYFDDVFNGKIVLNGLIQISDYNQDKTQRFQGTCFYFDTKIILRILDYSYPYLVETSRELLRLVKEEYNGRICVPSHIIAEIKYALLLAQIDMKKDGIVKNGEISFFQQQHSYSADDFKIAIDSLEETIKRQYGFEIIDDIDWDSFSTHKHCINTRELEAFIAQKNPEWSKRAISNDIKSILLVNINRKSDYSVKFGGKNKLPIFVTSNFKLVKDIREYTENKISSMEDIFWNQYSLPIITDYDLTCRLWVTSKSRMPISINLFKSSYLFQQSDGAFYEKVRQTYNAVKEKHQYNLVDLDYERFEKLKDLIIEKTQGDLEDINDDIVAISFKELATRESISKDIKISSLSDENAKKDEHIDNLKKDLIKSYAAPFITNTTIFERIVINLINYLPMICGIIGTVLLFLIDTILTKELITKSKLISFVPLIISIVFVVIDKYLDNSIISKLREKFVNYSKTKYTNKIEKNLPSEAEPYKEQIIKYCLTSKEIFKKQ